MKRQLIGFLTALFVIPSAAQQLPMDYSYCGYHHSEQAIPNAQVATYVLPNGQDDSQQLQAAIDYVSRQKADKQTGLRGAVLLGEGTFTLSQPLYIRTGGVVVRGMGRNRTVLRKTGYDRGALIYIIGTHSITAKDTLAVSDVQAGATTLTILGAKDDKGNNKRNNKRNNSVQSGSAALSKGSRILIWRPSTVEWIASLGCQSFGGGKRMGYWAWHPGDIDLQWHRTVTAVNGNTVTLDAPLTCSIEQKWGGAKAIVYEAKGLISECGVENLTLESTYDSRRPLDEDHCWDGIYVADAENCWVRMVNFRHFAGSAVVVQKSAQQVTIEDCQSLQPVSEMGGFRRRTFLTMGENTLFQRCYSEHGINDFAVGHTAPGPNAFVQCETKESFGPSGAISSWAPGILFDIVNVDGNDIVFKNWELEKFGAGWSTVNSTMWQSTASGLFCYQPDTLQRNVSYGCWGQVQGNGDYGQMNEHVKPYSLFAEQLLKRMSAASHSTPSNEVAARIQKQCRVLERNTNASSSPTIEEAIRMAEEALKPRITMQQWIDSARFDGDTSPTQPFAATTSARKNADKALFGKTEKHSHSVYALQNGWLCKDGALLVGGKHQPPWWNGRTTDAAMAKAKYALTRFVPGYEGTGGTDRIDSVICEMQRNHTLLFSQNYGLWTDRRRDDHERIRRKNGDAWAPFYEQPFARIGASTTATAHDPRVQGGSAQDARVQGGSAALSYSDLAWDGMSKYDLTTLNKWYFWRLQQFAKKSEDIGLLLKNQHYFQHNILEAGAHWVDCPWRTANNVNGTPFLEPVNFTGDKRIFTATLFYDTTNPTLRELHRQYIRQSLDEFKGQPNVIHSIGEDFTGPLHFVQFWLDVVAEWEQENGQVLVDLAVNKDVQDAILKDPVRSKVVDIIDIEQWFYHNKGEYAPPGGVNMAQRQYMRKIRTGGARFEDVYRAVSEYRSQYPEKAVIYSAQKYPDMCWASLMAGGSCAAIPVKDESILQSIATMRPAASPAKDVYLLQGDKDRLYYKQSATPLKVVLDGGSYVVDLLDEKTGNVIKTYSAKKEVTLEGKSVFLIRKK